MPPRLVAQALEQGLCRLVDPAVGALPQRRGNLQADGGGGLRVHRELSLEGLGMKAQLPPPEEKKKVKSAMQQAKVEQQRRSN